MYTGEAINTGREHDVRPSRKEVKPDPSSCYPLSILSTSVAKSYFTYSLIYKNNNKKQLQLTHVFKRHGPVESLSYKT